jgi:hypothetical protein
VIGVTEFQLNVRYIHAAVCVGQILAFAELLSSLDMWCLHFWFSI